MTECERFTPQTKIGKWFAIEVRKAKQLDQPLVILICIYSLQDIGHINDTLWSYEIYKTSHFSNGIV